MDHQAQEYARKPTIIIAGMNKDGFAGLGRRARLPPRGADNKALNFHRPVSGYKVTSPSLPDRDEFGPRIKVNNPSYFMKTNRILPSAFAALLAATALFAANERNEAGTVAAADKNFMVAAAEGGMLEVRLGEIAQKKGAKQDVKEFGAMMVADHGKAGEDLKAVSAKLDVKLPASLDAKHKAIVDKLESLSGSAFDKAYLDEMLKAHMKDASAFEDASKTAKDPDVKAFAQRTLPVVQAHLTRVKAMAKNE